jgi:hypothetical protein
MGRNIGSTEVIETKETDSVFYAQAQKSKVFTRFVKHRKAEPTNFLSMTLEKDEDGEYELTDINTGTFIPPLPGQDGATKKSIPFWNKHAVVMNGQAIQAKTVTTDSPY